VLAGGREMSCETLDLLLNNSCDRLSEGHTVLTTDPVWSTLLELDPSLRTSLCLCGHDRAETA